MAADAFPTAASQPHRGSENIRPKNATQRTKIESENRGYNETYSSKKRCTERMTGTTKTPDITQLSAEELDALIARMEEAIEFAKTSAQPAVEAFLEEIQGN